MAKVIRITFYGFIFGGIIGMALAQGKGPETTPMSAPPSLSTADRVALQTFEKAKKDSQQMFQDAQQGELQVLREWESTHPGWTINPQTFVIEKKVEAKK